MATEIDLAWTYVGGSQRLVEALLRNKRLEVLTTTPFHMMSYGSDLLTAALSGIDTTGLRRS